LPGNSNWTTRPPDERGDELRQLAREVLTPAQLEVFELDEAGVSYHRAAAMLGISRQSVRERADGASRRLAAALEARNRNGGPPP
jgi:DNA-directed RNA polymerase specialized sigma24 family protein